MNQPLTLRIAAFGMLIILSLFMLFHLLIISGIIPYEVVWGGRLTNKAQMLSFEGVSILINLLMLLVVSIHAGFVKVNINKKVLRAALWAMVVLFSFNTAGNAFSSNELEQMLFTPVTFILAVLSLVLARSKAHETAPKV